MTADGPQLDIWTDWLLRHGRGLGARSYAEARAAASGRLGQGAWMLDRMLDGVALQSGQRILDVGVGVGQIALEARRRVGDAGYVVGLDLSFDALRECRTESGFQMGAVAALGLAQADAIDLPIADECFDQITIRSVLMYIRDKARAVRELYRVLRGAGRVSMFEPITRRGHQYEIGLADLGRLHDAHRRVIAHIESTSMFTDEMTGFDERDVVAWFADAGFTRITSRLEHSRKVVGPDSQSEAHGRMLIGVRFHPGAISIEEAAHAVLGEGADSYLAGLHDLLRTQPLVQEGLTVILNAVR